MSNNTFTLQNIDKVNFYGNDGSADVYLEGVSTGTSGVCISGSLLVNGDYMNFGTSLGTSGHGFRSSDSGGSIQFKHSGGEWITISGASVAGSNNEIQFNDNGNFGACAGFTFDNSTNNFVVGANDNIIGPGDGFTSENIAIVGGTSNGVSGFGFNSGVFCGSNNLIEASSSVILAGRENIISDAIGPTVIVGGLQNRIGDSSHIAGGRYSVIAGGKNNKVFEISSFIGGGENNGVSGKYSGNIAGANNGVSGKYSGNIAGQDNKTDGDNSSIIAGQNNTITTSVDYSVIAGGVSNQAYADMVFVAGGFNNSVSGISSSAIAGFSNQVNDNNSSNIAGRVNTVNGESCGNIVGSSNEVGGIFSVNIGGINNIVKGSRVANLAGENNGVSGEHSGNIAGQTNSVFSNNTVALGGEGLSTQTGTSWERMALAGTYNNYLTYPWDESGAQTLQGTCYRFLVGSGGEALTGNNAFAVDNVGNLYFGTQAGACIYTRTGTSNYEPINLGGGGGTTTPSGPENSVQFNRSSAFTGTSSLQFFEASLATGGVCALTVDGNVFSSMGVSDVRNQTPSNPYQITAEDFVNGFIFPPCQSSDENQLFVVRVPTYTDIALSFSDVLKEGQTFDTVIYGTSIGSSPGIGISFPSDITVLENTGTIFDRRLGSGDNQISTGLSFHFAGLDLKYYQGVVIRSRMGSNGVSMYPYATSFYTC